MRALKGLNYPIKGTLLNQDTLDKCSCYHLLVMCPSSSFILPYKKGKTRKEKNTTPNKFDSQKSKNV